MNKKVLTVLGLSLALGLTACGGAGGNKPAENNAGNKANNAPTANAQANANANANHNHAEEADAGQDHGHGEFEFMAEYELDAGDYTLKVKDAHHDHMDVGFVLNGANIEDLDHHAAHLMATEPEESAENGGKLAVQKDYAYEFKTDDQGGETSYTITIPEKGTWALAFGHGAGKEGIELVDAQGNVVAPKAVHEGGDHDH